MRKAFPMALFVSACALFVAAAVSAPAVPTNYEPIGSKVCASTAGANVGPQAPRITSTGLASSDLGSYAYFDCSTGSCKMDTSAFNGISVNSLMQPPPTSPLRYAQGIAFYAILNVILVVLVPLGAAIFILFRYCCCCCRANRCTCLRCGTPWPTKRTLCCGFRELANGELGYTCMDRAFTYAYLLAFMLLTIGLLVSAELFGNQGLTKGMLKLVDAHDGLGKSVSALVHSVLPPVQELVVSLSDSALAPLLVGINATLAAAVDLSVVHDSLVCVNASLYGLPDIGTAIGFLDSLNASLTSVKAHVGAVEGGIRDLDTEKGWVQGNASALSDTLTGLGWSFGNVSTRLDTCLGYATSLAVFKGDLITAGTGLLPAAKTDLVALGANYPTDADLNAAAGPASLADTSGTQTMNRLIAGAGGAGGMEGSASEINGLVTRLAAIGASLAALPDLAGTAGKLQAINDRIYAVRVTQGTITALNASLASVQAGLAAVPRSSAVTPKVTAIVAAADAVSLAPLLVAVRGIQADIAGLPDFNVLLRELAKVRTVRAIIPCLIRVTDQVTTINATFARLPDSIRSITDIVGTINGTLEDAIGMVDTTDAQVRSANDTIHGTDTASYVSQIDSVNTTLVTQRASLNVSSLTSSLGDLDTKTTVDFSTIVGSLASLDATLAGAAINATTIQLLRDLAVTVAWLRGNITAESALYTAYAQGYCTGGSNDGTYCAGNGACTGGGTCTRIARKRCSSGAGAGQATDCTADSQCVAGQYCLVDSTRAARLKVMLAGAAGAKPDTAAAVTSIDSATASAGGVDIGGSIVTITDAKAAIAAIDVTSYKSTLNSMTAGFSSFDTSATLSTLTSIRGTIDSVPFGSARNQLDSIRSTVDDLVTSKRAMVGDAADAVGAMATLLYTDLHGYVRRMSRAQLSAAGSSRGVAGVLLALAGVADDVLAEAKAAAGKLASVPSINATDMLLSFLPYMDRAGSTGEYAHNDAHGPLYYLVALAAPGMVLSADDPAAYSALAQADGTAYPDGKYCLTSECLSVTIKGINTGPISGLRKLASGLPSLPLPLSRENVLLIPWVFPLLALLFGLWGMTSRLCCRSAGWQKVPSSCMVGVILCQLPCIFLITGLLFPLGLVLTDVCASGTNIGYNYVLLAGDDACGMVSGTGTGAACTVSKAVSMQGVSLNVTSTINLPAMYRGLVGVCPAQSRAADPIFAAFADVADQLQDIPYAKAHDLLAGSGASALPGGLELRPGVTDVVYAAANATGDTASAFVSSIGTSVLSCGRVNAVLADLKEGLCCNIVTPFFWYISAWYLVGWAMLLCGLPAGCLARKRLPSGLWGPAYALAVVDAAAGQAGEGAALGQIKITASAAPGAAGGATEIAGARPASPRPAPGTTVDMTAQRRRPGSGGAPAGSLAPTLGYVNVKRGTGAASGHYDATMEVDDVDFGVGRGSILAPQAVRQSVGGSRPASASTTSRQATSATPDKVLIQLAQGSHGVAAAYAPVPVAVGMPAQYAVVGAPSRTPAHAQVVAVPIMTAGGMSLHAAHPSAPGFSGVNPMGTPQGRPGRTVVSPPAGSKSPRV